MADAVGGDSKKRLNISLILAACGKFRDQFVEPPLGAMRSALYHGLVRHYTAVHYTDCIYCDLTEYSDMNMKNEVPPLRYCTYI